MTQYAVTICETTCVTKVITVDAANEDSAIAEAHRVFAGADVPAEVYRDQETLGVKGAE